MEDESEVPEICQNILDILEYLNPFCQKANYEQMKFFFVFVGININFDKKDIRGYKDKGFSEFDLRNIMDKLVIWIENENKIKFICVYMKKVISSNKN